MNVRVVLGALNKEKVSVSIGGIFGNVESHHQSLNCVRFPGISHLF
jgi:hypothetical protein